MFRQIGAGEIIVIVVVLIVLFGARKLPELARSIGASAKEFRKGIEEGATEEREEEAGVDEPAPKSSESSEP